MISAFSIVIAIDFQDTLPFGVHVDFEFAARRIIALDFQASVVALDFDDAYHARALQ